MRFTKCLGVWEFRSEKRELTGVTVSYRELTGHLYCFLMEREKERRSREMAGNGTYRQLTADENKISVMRNGRKNFYFSLMVSTFGGLRGTFFEVSCLTFRATNKRTDGTSNEQML
jgi:hypothetical protein